MNTTRKWKLVSLTSTTATTTMFSIYKNDHNKVCGGPMKELIQGSTWLTHLIPETVAAQCDNCEELLFLLSFHELILLTFRRLLFKLINLKKHKWDHPLHLLSSFFFFREQLKHHFSERPSLTKMPNNIKLNIIYCNLSVCLTLRLESPEVQKQCLLYSPWGPHT